LPRQDDVAFELGQYMGENLVQNYAYDEALVYYRRAHQLAAWLSDSISEANILQTMGDVWQLREDRDSALHYYEKALSIYDQVDITSKKSFRRQKEMIVGKANTIQAIGDVNWFYMKTDKALLQYQSALILYQQVGYAHGEASTQKAIGDVQYFRMQLDQAKRSYHEALASFRKATSLFGEAEAMLAIADVYLFKKQQRLALDQANTALNLYRQVGARLGEAHARLVIGDVLLSMHYQAPALENYQSALKLYRHVHSQLGEANALLALGDLYLLPIAAPLARCMMAKPCVQGSGEVAVRMRASQSGEISARVAAPKESTQARISSVDWSSSVRFWVCSCIPLRSPSLTHLA